MRHGVCYAIIRAFNLDSCTLRHLDRYLEETVEGVGRVLPAAAVLQRLAAVDLVCADNAIRVQVWIPCHDRCVVLHFNHRLQLTVRIRRVKPSDILFPHLCRTAAAQLATCRVRRRLEVAGRNAGAILRQPRIWHRLGRGQRIAASVRRTPLHLIDPDAVRRV